MSSWLLAQVAVEQLLQAGVRAVVLAPGSRNAPLSIALERAARRGDLALHVRIDERSAGFLALGMAKASLEAGVRYLAGSLGEDGIRVNAISAGPIRTLAASGIASFRKMLAANEKQTPMRRNVTIDEVGNAGAFLCSDLASGISGEILYVDGGFNTTAMGSLED